MEGMPFIESCHVCQSRNAVIRCMDCCNVLYCNSCDEAFHQGHPFHDREAFMDGFFQPIPPTTTVDDDGCLTTKCE